MLAVAILALQSPSRDAVAAGTDSRVVTTPPASLGGGGAATAATSASAPAASASSAPATGSSANTSPAPGSSTGVGPRAAGSLPLIVLNDTGTARLAHQAAARFETAGWTVTATNEHYVNEIISTVAYYDPTVRGARRAAAALQRQFPTIKRVVPRFPELPDGPVVVVLTSDYSPS